MTEMDSAEAEAPIEDGDSLPPEENTDAPEAPVDEHDKLEDFQPSVGWPDPGFEHVAFPTQPDEGVS